MRRKEKEFELKKLDKRVERENRISDWGEGNRWLQNEKEKRKIWGYNGNKR